MKRKSPLITIISWTILPFIFSCALAANPAPSGMKRANAHGIDTSFLHRNPWRKQKLSVDLDNVHTAEDMKIIEASLDEIIKFVAMVSNDPPSGVPVPLAVTSAGRTNLRRPPIDQSRSMPQRFSHIREYDWDVRGAGEIALTADFGIVPGRPVYTDRFVFIKEDGAWKFDRHEWPAPRTAIK